MMYKLIQNGDYKCENIAFKK
ncbi:hypothetical protein HW059_001704, partial [Campylobacter coli]|nr:hypothetical protein [Campylobacter coli]